MFTNQCSDSSTSRAFVSLSSYLSKRAPITFPMAVLNDPNVSMDLSDSDSEEFDLEEEVASVLEDIDYAQEIARILLSLGGMWTKPLLAEVKRNVCNFLFRVDYDFTLTPVPVAQSTDQIRLRMEFAEQAANYTAWNRLLARANTQLIHWEKIVILCKRKAEIP
jgi:hypothetical protein